MQESLTARELDVLRLAAQGLKNHEIAARLGLALKTVEHMLGRSDPYRAIYCKIEVANRAEAIAWYCSKFGDPRVRSSEARLSEQLLEMFWDYAGHIYMLRLAGQPQLAGVMAGALIARAAQAAAEAGAASAREAFLRVRVKALIEQGTLALETAPRAEVLPRVKPVAADLQALAHELHDADVMATAHMVLAGAYNIGKQYGVGRMLYARALATVQNEDLQLRSLRGLAIAATYLNDRDEIAAVKLKAQALIDAGRFTSLEQVCETLEGVGRAQGLVGLKGAAQWFEAAEQLLHPLGSPPLRRLQVITSKLEVLRRTNPAATGEIERMGQAGIQLANQHGYPRHRAHLVEMLEKALDS
jgi:DNA-binding CsgD family transcriptional regulator